MRERAQASGETIGLVVAVMALAGALAFGVVRLGPAVAGSLRQALSGAFGAGTPEAPGLSPFERLLLTSATSGEAEGATLLDVRTSLRARLGQSAGDGAFDATVRPLVVRALEAHSITGTPGDVVVVDRQAEDSWLRGRLSPSFVRRAASFVVDNAGPPGAVVSIVHDSGLLPDDIDGIKPGHEAGDLLVAVDHASELFVLRRRPGTGLTIVSALFPGRSRP
jgi:hypothetical protein